MKTLSPPIKLSGFVALAGAFLFHGFRLLAGNGEDTLEQQFPNVIQFELGASGFSAGDQITITAVRGNRKHIEPGGNYLVEGSYALASADEADLAFHCTSRGPGGPSPVQDGQHVRITKGTGTFHLCKINLADGWLHVSFYPNNSSLHGGVYFGEKGNEKSIMRNSDWFREFAVKPSVNHKAISRDFDGKANAALAAYLGNPVLPPARMNAQYNKGNLLAAFTNLCEKSGLIITKLAVDDSEFPFLLYGTLDGKHTLPEKAAFEEQKGYTYGGAVRGSAGEGSTYFAVNMIPSSQYPEDQKQACNRRLMLRLQMLADKAGQTQ